MQQPQNQPQEKRQWHQPMIPTNGTNCMNQPIEPTNWNQPRAPTTETTNGANQWNQSMEPTREPTNDRPLTIDRPRANQRRNQVPDDHRTERLPAAEGPITIPCNLQTATADDPRQAEPARWIILLATATLSYSDQPQLIGERLL